MSLMPWQGHHSQEREVKPFGWEFLSLSFVLTHQDNGQLIANLLCRESLGLSLIQKCSWSVWTQRGERKNKHKKVQSRSSAKLNVQLHVFSPEILVNGLSVAATATFETWFTALDTKQRTRGILPFTSLLMVRRLLCASWRYQLLHLTFWSQNKLSGCSSGLLSASLLPFIQNGEYFPFLALGMHTSPCSGGRLVYEQRACAAHSFYFAVQSQQLSDAPRAVSAPKVTWRRSRWRSTGQQADCLGDYYSGCLCAVPLHQI